LKAQGPQGVRVYRACGLEGVRDMSDMSGMSRMSGMSDMNLGTALATPGNCRKRCALHDLGTQVNRIGLQR
jgi:hypothetical protein